MKQVIIVRKDLKMGKGKLCTQIAHASVAALLKTMRVNRNWVEKWMKEGQKKIVLKISSEEELLNIYKEVSKELPAEIIRDAGLTQLEPGTITAIGIGPAPDEMVDRYTSHLKLL